MFVCLFVCRCCPLSLTYHGWMLLLSRHLCCYVVVAVAVVGVAVVAVLLVVVVGGVLIIAICKNKQQ